MVRLFVASAMLISAAVAPGAPPRAVDYTIQLDVIREGYDGVHCWVHPRAGIVPNSNGGAPSIVLTLQQLWLKGSDVFGPLHEMRTDDLGRTWSGPRRFARGRANSTVVPSPFGARLRRPTFVRARCLPA